MTENKIYDKVVYTSGKIRGVKLAAIHTEPKKERKMRRKINRAFTKLEMLIVLGITSLVLIIPIGIWCFWAFIIVHFVRKFW